MRRNRAPLLFAFCVMAGIGTLFGEDWAKRRAIPLEATIDGSFLTLHWPRLEHLGRYRLKILGDDGSQRWMELPGGTDHVTDEDLKVGRTYEYLLVGEPTAADGENAYGTLLGGIEVPLKDDAGSVVLLVDERQAAPLADRLERLRRDLVSEGWQVRRFDVPAETSAVALRELLRALHAEPSKRLRCVFLIGRLAVPYSGALSPDGHAVDHHGAWPADVYYGELEREWKDRQVHVIGARREANHNRPWDGKWDRSLVSGVTLAVGRVDFSDLPAFAASDTALLGHYLDKNHAYRRGHFRLPRRGLVEDHLTSLREAPGSGALRAFPGCFGREMTVRSDWNTHLLGDGDGSAMAVAMTSGGYTSLDHISTTQALAEGRDYRVGFAFAMASYAGDWDSENNILRALLASGNHVVGTAFYGRPIWPLHRLAMGEPLGKVLWHAQNDASSLYRDDGLHKGRVHVALMGDPTLRLHVIPPVNGLEIRAQQQGLPSLTWAASDDPGDRFHVYRAPTEDGPFTRLTSGSLSEPGFADESAPAEAVYMVRVVRLESTPSGTYWNASGGVMAAWRAPGRAAAVQQESAKVTVEAIDPVFYEAGSDRASFRFRREGGYVQMPLTLSFALVGVVPQVDVKPVGSEITFPPGETEVILRLEALGNDQLDEARAAVLVLDADAGLSRGTFAEVRLLDPPADQWRKRMFPRHWHRERIAGFEADPDGDGYTNLLEYALDGDPLSPDSLAPRWRKGEDGKERLRYRRRRDGTDLEWGWEQHAGERRWLPIDLMEMEVDSVWEVSVPWDVARGLYRLRITLDRGLE